MYLCNTGRKRPGTRKKRTKRKDKKMKEVIRKAKTKKGVKVLAIAVRGWEKQNIDGEEKDLLYLGNIVAIEIGDRKERWVVTNMSSLNPQKPGYDLHWMDMCRNLSEEEKKDILLTAQVALDKATVKAEKDESYREWQKSHGPYSKKTFDAAMGARDYWRSVVWIYKLNRYFGDKD